MLVYSCKKILSLIPVVLGVVTIVCLLIHLVPGDPADVILGEFATAAEKAQLRERLGLTQPALTQLWEFLRGALHGDLGQSLIYNRSVSGLITERMGATFELAVLAMLVATCVAIPLGIVGALQRGRPVDIGTTAFALIGVAVPNFWLGPLLIVLFSVKLGWLPVSERASWASYVLPALTLGTSLAAFLSRMTRTSFLDTLHEDYVRTAASKGNTRRRIVLKHVLRNAILPVITVMGLQFGVLLTGAVVTEKVFDWPGVGSLMLEALGNRDYPLVQGCVLVFSCVYLAVNLLTDLVSALFDPRIRLGGGQ